MDNPIKKAIKEIVEARQGCKATELVVFIAEERPELLVVLGEVIEAVDELIHEGEIVEVEYILPTMDYRVKSFLLPKGTQIIVHDGKPR